MKKQRFRNYALWASLVSQLALLVQVLAFAMGWRIEDEQIQAWVAVADVILGILSTLGIISNPTKPDSRGYNL